MPGSAVPSACTALNVTGGEAHVYLAKGALPSAALVPGSIVTFTLAYTNETSREAGGVVNAVTKSGGNEFTAGTCQVKDLKTATQQDVPMGEVVAAVRRILER